MLDVNCSREFSQCARIGVANGNVVVDKETRADYSAGARGSPGRRGARCTERDLLGQR